MEPIVTELLRIRPLDPGCAEDCAAALAVYQACADFLALGPASATLAVVLADLEHSRQQMGQFCAVELLPGCEVAGVVDFVPAGFEGDPTLAFIELLMIAAPQRSRGLGAAVVRAVEDAVRAGGHARAVQAAVQINNPRALQFWQRAGYAVLSAPEQQPDGTVTVRVGKPL